MIKSLNTNLKKEIALASLTKLSDLTHQINTA